MRELLARAPARIDFGGGWTDVPPYTVERGGYVCNLAISRRATVRLRASQHGVAVDAEGELASASRVAELAREGGLGLVVAALRRAAVEDVAIETRAGFPRGAGLGGSSAMGVALQAALAAWCGERVDAATLAERSRRVEVEELRVAGGSQDHYAAAFGGALALRCAERVTVRRIPLSRELVEAIERQCVVAYTGQSRISGETITAVLDAYRAGDRRVTAALARMAELAMAMAPVLERGALDELGAMVAEHWEHQRALHPRITTPAIERVLAVARDAGAYGGKALGASGGGCVLVIAPVDRAAAVRSAVSAVAEPLPFRVDEVGACVRLGGVTGDMGDVERTGGAGDAGDAGSAAGPDDSWIPVERGA
jgi:D-glycero-alpha-D-manno-heptose-7-phosphate kinase